MKTAMGNAMTTYNDTTKSRADRDKARDLAQGIVYGAHAAKTSKAFESVKVGNKGVIEDLSLGKYR